MIDEEKEYIDEVDTINLPIKYWIMKRKDGTYYPGAIGFIGNEEFYFDAEDKDIVTSHKWHKTKGGYLSTRTGPHKWPYMQRLILQKYEDMTGKVSDHINKNKLDNRKSNLRSCSQQENCCNRQKMKTSNAKIIGVNKAGNKYKATISANGKQIIIGYFDKFEDAVVARLKAEKEIYGEFAPQKDKFAEYGV